jgi:chromosome segregation ATPase
LSPTDVPDIYHRQAETISKLTEDNEKLVEDVKKLEAKEKRLSEIEAEKDKLQELLAEVREELRGVKGKIDGAEEGKKHSEEELEKMVLSPVHPPPFPHLTVAEIRTGSSQPADIAPHLASHG